MIATMNLRFLFTLPGEHNKRFSAVECWVTTRRGGNEALLASAGLRQVFFRFRKIGLETQRLLIVADCFLGLAGTL